MSVPMMTSLFVYRQVGNSYILGNLGDGSFMRATESDIVTLTNRGYLISGVSVNGNQYWISPTDLQGYPHRCACGCSSVVVKWQDIAFDILTGREVFVAEDVLLSFKYGTPMYNIKPVYDSAVRKLGSRLGSVILSTINGRTPSQRILMESGVDMSCLGAVCQSCGLTWLPRVITPQR